MSVVSADIKQVLSESIPTDDVSASGGDIDGSETEFSNGTVGEFIPKFSIDATDPITWYYKMFSKNDNATDTWIDVRFWMDNLLLTVVAAGTVALVSSSASDNDDYKCKIVGENAGGTEITEVVEMNGTTTVYSANSFAKIHYVQFYDYSVPASPVITEPVGNISITRGILLGKIPAGVSSALGNVEIGLDLDIDGDLEAANRLTAPTDVVFSKPNTMATSIACTGADQEIPAQSAQGIWIKLTFEGGVASASRLNFVISQYGDSA